MNECPKCGAPMEYIEPDPDVGIEGDVYQCTACDEWVPAEHEEKDYD